LTNVSSLSAHRVRIAAQVFWAAYGEHAERLGLLGLQIPCLARTDDEDHVLVDLAACITIAHSLARLRLSAPLLQQLKVSDPLAHRLLTRSTTAYFSSREIRDELGRIAVLPFEQLQMALSDAA
jgi:hypothetical protein